MLPIIQAISESEPDQAVPFLTYIRQHSSTPREDTAQYDRYVLHPARKLQMRKHPNFIQRQQTTWKREPLQTTSGLIRSESLPGPLRECTP